MSRCALTVIGDVLLDRHVDGDIERLCPDTLAPVFGERSQRTRPGGAGLAAALAVEDGARVTLATAVAEDGAARELRGLLNRLGLAEVIDLHQEGSTSEKISLIAGRRLLCRYDRGNGVPRATPEAEGRIAEALSESDAALVSDYGCGVTGIEPIRKLLERAGGRIPVVWDPHPRGAEPVPGICLATPNRAEALGACGLSGERPRIIEEAARTLRRRWSVDGVAITLGPEGALLVDEDASAIAIPAPAVARGDPCGAGDRFASAAAAALGRGARLREAVTAAVRAASGFVEAGGAGSPPSCAGAQPASEVVASVRAAGGKVVATGGCFDLLHIGHIRMLQTARSLGDCLIVCVNSDESVRRLKGSDRPIIGEEDRVAVLAALACVDAVELFDEGTPERILDELRPDVWAKGGDYEESELAEATVVRRHGGRVVVLPYIEGQSTTQLLEELLERVS